LWETTAAGKANEIVGLTLASLGFVILALCLVRPDRSLQDYITGTYLVLR
jgi:hypothetical protein